MRLRTSPRTVIVVIASVILLVATVVAIALGRSPSTQDATTETTQEAFSKPERTVPQGGWKIQDLGRTVWTGFRPNYWVGAFPPQINERGQVVFSLRLPRLPEDADPYELRPRSTTTAARYERGRVVRLPNLPGGMASSPAAINDHGEVVGWARTRGGAHAVLWSDGGVIDLGTLGGAESGAHAINERGQVVGYADTEAEDEWGDPVWHAFLWEDGEMLDVTPGSSSFRDAVAINERGQIIGEVDPHAFMWESGRLTRLPGLVPNHRFCEAVAINDRGQIVGSSMIFDPGWPNVAVLWQDGRVRKLGTLGGRVSESKAVNERGQVVGRSGTLPGAMHAFLWEKNRMIDLGTLGGKMSGATDINEQGQIVGWSDFRGAMHAFLWEKNRMIDLGTLGGANSAATDINDRGEIVGFSTNAKGEQHAVLWMKR